MLSQKKCVAVVSDGLFSTGFNTPIKTNIQIHTHGSTHTHKHTHKWHRAGVVEGLLTHNLTDGDWMLKHSRWATSRNIDAHNSEIQLLSNGKSSDCVAIPLHQVLVGLHPFCVWNAGWAGDRQIKSDRHINGMTLSYLGDGQGDENENTHALLAMLIIFNDGTNNII